MDHIIWSLNLQRNLLKNFPIGSTTVGLGYDDLIGFWIVVIRIVEKWFRLIQMAKEQSSEYKRVIWLPG